MIDIENIRKTVVTGLSEYLNIPVIRNNQTSEPPKYPYCSYGIIKLGGENKGTYGEYPNNVYQKTIIQTWSFTVQSNDNAEAMELTIKAYDYFDLVGCKYLADNNVIVQLVTDISERDNLISIEYEYRHGFDVKFYIVNKIIADTNYIESVELINLNKQEVKNE